MTRTVCLVGARGPVSVELQRRLLDSNYALRVLPTDDALSMAAESLARWLEGADLLVLATLDFASAEVLARTPKSVRVLDVSPAFRTAPGWTYGLPEVVGERCIASASRVANPGCFATAAILLLAPLSQGQALIDLGQPAVFQATGGYTTGGQSLISKAEDGALAAEAAYSLAREHRHIAEIRAATQFSGPLWLTPSIANYPRGIRVSLPLLGIDARTALERYEEAYAGSHVEVLGLAPSRLTGDVWAHRDGAGIWVAPQAGVALAICALDNLGKGAVSSAFDNIELMLRSRAA